MVPHKTTLFPCLANKEFFSGTRKLRNFEINAFVLEYIKDLRNKRFPLTWEVSMSEAEDCAINRYFSAPVVDGVKSLRRQDA
jgi:hypothetical protein